MIKKRFSLICIILVTFQMYAFALNSKIVSNKDKNDFYTKLFSNENLKCNFEDEYSVKFNNTKICGMFINLDFIEELVKAVLNKKESNLTYSSLEELSGLKVLTKPYDKNEGINYYNQDMVVWFFNNFYIKPNNILFGENTNNYYKALLKKDIRIYVKVYLGMQKNNNYEKTVLEFKDYMKKNPETGYNFYAGAVYDRFERDEDGLEDRVILFWLRRGLDGTDKTIFTYLKKVVTDYDNDWFKSLKNN
ncbi:MAG: hypothetical protein U0457_13905 [Candidatus Sericytochromatia bacterium]